MTQTQRVPASGEIRLDKRAHVAGAGRSPEIQVETAWNRDHVDLSAHGRPHHIPWNLGCDRPIGHEQWIEWRSPLGPHQAADLYSSCGAGDGERPREASGRGNV